MELNSNHYIKEILSAYKRHLDRIADVAEMVNTDSLNVEDRTFDLIALMASSICHTHRKAVWVKQRYKTAVRVREMFCFIAYLFFDYKSQRLADEFNVTRQVIHHYCLNIITEYEVYADSKENLLRFFSEEDVMKMIARFNAKKRNKELDETENPKRQVAKVC